jgi:PAS domain S-box-containing protein
MLFTTRKNSRKALHEKIERLETRLKLATGFLSKIAEGDQALASFELNADEKDEEGKLFLEKLTRTKEKLAEYTQRDRERVWVAEGMSKFMDVIQGDRTAKDFYDKVLTMILRYSGAIQGGLFMLNEEDPEDSFLELKACYAYSRKKFVEKKIGLGQGMLGQCFIEKETNIFTTVPNNYFDITSGLGEATPRFLVIVPLKYDQQVMGVLEVASFEKMPAYKIEFIEKLCENMASVALNIVNTTRANKLYEESQLREKRLQEQEEVLRQNIEELEATQDEMKRHQRELDQRTYLMKFIIDNIPFPIFVKDEKGRYTLVNKTEAKLFGLPDTELIGKDDSYFVSNKEEWRVIQESDALVLASDDPLELPTQYFTTPSGVSYVFKTTKIPFVNNSTGKKNILGVSIDLTERLRLENKLVQERGINATNTLINLAGRQRMLTQKIGFYAEVVGKGKSQYVTELKNAVDQFEHSFGVIKDGGTPIGIKCEHPLEKSERALFPLLKNIDDLWLPYKDAVKKILYYTTFQDSVTASVKDYEIEQSLSYIEANAENLLSANNDLMLACIQLNEVRDSIEA